MTRMACSIHRAPGGLVKSSPWPPPPKGGASERPNLIHAAGGWIRHSRAAVAAPPGTRALSFGTTRYRLCGLLATVGVLFGLLASPSAIGGAAAQASPTTAAKLAPVADSYVSYAAPSTTYGTSTR